MIDERLQHITSAIQGLDKKHVTAVKLRFEVIAPVGFQHEQQDVITPVLEVTFKD
jgi:uncharacterized protein YabE (DUF348 family)